jgi:predicted TIM-barrel fold metal-dependent hydrolase
MKILVKGLSLFVLGILFSCSNGTQSSKTPTKIIDMHIHSYTQSDFGAREPDVDHYGVKGSANADIHIAETFEAFKKYNVVKAMVSGNPESVENGVAYDKDKKVIKGLLIYHPDDYGLDSVAFEQMIKDKKIEIFGEVAPYYSGTTLSDYIWQPYLRICEKYDIPVAVNTGSGEPNGTYNWSPKARLKYGDPYLIEDVLVRYPKLRIYMMHAGGEDWPEHGIRLMAYYLHLYTDLAVLLWVEPNTQRYILEFLRNAKTAGYIDRIMFGSDQMKWPYVIGKSVDFLNSLDLLSEKRQHFL